jgi:hypothetical protein
MLWTQGCGHLRYSARHRGPPRPLLRRMDKGVSAPQNIALMRYARAISLSLTWNLLYAFPRPTRDYEQTLALVPLLHLNPSGGCPT